MNLLPLAVGIVLNPGQLPEVKGQIRTPPGNLKLDPNVQLTPKPPYEIKFSLFSMSYQKAEDGDGKDEPYLFSAGFRFNIAHDLRGFFIGASGIEVFPITPLGHHNLGYPGNGWARSGRRYQLTGQTWSTTVPQEGGLQVVGYLTMLQEQDGWNADQIRRFADDFPRRFKKHLEGLQFETVKKPQSYIDGTVRQIGDWLYDFQAAKWITFMRPFGSGDSDDAGGTNFALAINFGPNPPEKARFKGVQFTTSAGYRAANMGFQELRRSGGNNALNFSFAYPQGLINTAPPDARWKGQCLLAGFALRTP